ncbi:6-bladed beta-propeller [Balneola sp. MJW-20]|uniref:6-bladed beta-propeller n=1 Tax=Gracilimonas aurantiaca TaxID=3234185 RepID=UPI0034670BD7
MKYLITCTILLLSLCSCTSDNKEGIPDIIAYPMGLNTPSDSRTYFEPGSDLTAEVIENSGNRDISVDALELIRTYDFSQDTQIYKPAYAQFNDSLIYVFDNSIQQVRLLSRSGQLLKSIGRKGSGPGEFGAGFDMKVDNSGKIYVSDLNLSRVSIFNPDGSLNQTVNVKNGQRLALLGSGNFVQTIAAEENIISLMDSEGNEIMKLGNFGSAPMLNAALSPELESDGVDQIFTAFTYAGYIVSYDTDGNKIFTSTTISQPGEMPHILTIQNIRTTGADHVITWDIAYTDDKLFLIGGHRFSNPDKPDLDEITHTAIDIYSAKNGVYQTTVLIEGNFENLTADRNHILIFNKDLAQMKLFRISGL